jgi:hypothetical protein
LFTGASAVCFIRLQVISSFAWFQCLNRGSNAVE